MDAKEEFCTVQFPPGLVVHGAPGAPIAVTKGKGVLLEGVPLAKALKHAHQNSDVTVTGPDGEVLAAPRVELADNRQESAAKVAAGQAGEIAELKATVASLTASLDRKQDKRGRKPAGVA